MKKKTKLKNSDSNYTVVYSTDPELPKRCSGCQRLPDECKCGPSKFRFANKPSYRIERKGRGGKTVTIVSNLPPHETLLKDLCKFLKRSVGGGGTHYVEGGAGSIEIQGERIDELRKLVEKFKIEHYS